MVRGGDKEGCPRKIFIRVLRENPARESKTLVPKKRKTFRAQFAFLYRLVPMASKSIATFLDVYFA